MTSSEMLESLLASAPAGARKELKAEPGLGERFAEQVAAVQAAAGFAAFVGAKLPPVGAARAIESMRLADLALVYRCVEKDPEAVRQLDKLVAQQVEKEARRLGVADVAEEARQLILQQLLVSRTGERSVLTQFSGRGDLAAWVRIIAVRELLRLRKTARKSLGSDAAALSGLVASGDDPELGMLRNQFKDEFRAAFAHAVKGLTERERNLLRQHFVDGLSIDEIASVYAIHRATAARWVAKAKEAVSEATQHEIRQRIDINTNELDSLLRLVRDRLDISMRLLHSGEQ